MPVYYLCRPSLLNHSCWPNCTVCYNGRTLNIKMLEDVSDDQEVIKGAYVDVVVISLLALFSWEFYFWRND